jgi:hypothetical protein
VLALASLNVPASQLAQAVSPDAALKEPGTQALQFALETWEVPALTFPATQVSHCVLLRSTANWPGPHTGKEHT